MFLESLESRQLLSAAHPAAKTKVPIPTITGFYEGTAVDTKTHQTQDVSIDITSESAKGVLAGTGTEGTTSGYVLTGKVTNKDKVTFKIKSGKKTLIANGTYASSDTSAGSVISGKYSAPKTHGTFNIIMQVG
ncbi:MAG TPA: hypothetical protein VGG19_04485 [Tepidisphaeraceae bacterium]|jgi:hypothetical protein